MSYISEFIDLWVNNTLRALRNILTYLKGPQQQVTPHHLIIIDDEPVPLRNECSLTDKPEQESDPFLERLLTWDKKKPIEPKLSVENKEPPKGKKVKPTRKSKWEMVKELISSRQDPLRFYQTRVEDIKTLKLRYINKRPSQPILQKQRHYLAKLYTDLIAKVATIDPYMAQRWQIALRRILGPYLGQRGETVWFNDTVVDTYMELLAKTYTTDNKRVANLLSTEYRQENFFEYIAQAKAGAKRYQTLYQHLKSADVILWPFSYSGELVRNRRNQKRDGVPIKNAASGNHWGLLVIEKVKNDANLCVGFSLRTLDGFNMADLHLAGTQKGKELLEILYAGESCLKQINTQQLFMPVQNNGDDCGPAITRGAAAYFKDPLLTSYQQFKDIRCKYKHERVRVLEALAQLPPEQAAGGGRFLKTK